MNPSMGSWLARVYLAWLRSCSIAKLLTTGLCVGSGMSGGVFAPSLFIGAMLGCLFGHVVNLFWPDLPLSPAHYGLIGMGAFVAGTTLCPHNGNPDYF